MSGGLDSENGALLLAHAFAPTRSFPDSRSNEVAGPILLSRTNEWSSETHSLVADYVQTNAPALEKAREALRFSRFRYPVDYSFGPDTELPHVPGLKNLAKMAGLQAGARCRGWPHE